ncbi:hypothetical protein GGR07_001300 [Bacteroides pyogenes]|nr:hypothetical protein [Bacteroides pyogenes]SUV33328.1 Uncharacterised protein [Bacteroides pyogenes]
MMSLNYSHLYIYKRYRINIQSWQRIMIWGKQERTLQPFT